MNCFEWLLKGKTYYLSGKGYSKIIIQGNPKQEQTKGKLFTKTGEYRRPNIGEFYFSEVDKVACLSEDFGMDFPEDVKRYILEPVI